MIDKNTNEFKCDLCEGWFDLPYQYFHKQRVCKECKDHLEDEYEMKVDQARDEGRFANIEDLKGSNL